MAGCGAFFYDYTRNVGFGPKLPNGLDYFTYLDELYLSYFFTTSLVTTIAWLGHNLRAREEEDLNHRRVLRSLTSRRAAIAEVVGKLLHEINNPLAIIQGSLQVYRQRPSQPGLDIFAQDALLRIEGILNNLKIFAQGDPKEPMQIFTVGDLFRAVRIHSHEIAQRHSTDLRIKEPGLLRLRGRYQQLLFVLQSLLDNAIEACQTCRNRNRYVRVEALLGTSGQLRCEVADNGSGILPKLADAIFQPFVTTKSQSDSIGLALSVCHGIIREHGGHIGFVRRKEETIFWFELPQIEPAT